MFKFVQFLMSSDLFSKLDLTQVRVQIVGELESNRDWKFAIFEGQFPNPIPETLSVVVDFPARVIPCISVPTGTRYLNKAAIINNRWSQDDQTKLLRKMVANNPTATAEFTLFNEFCEAIP